MSSQPSPVHDDADEQIFPSEENTQLQIEILAALMGLEGKHASGQEIKDRLTGTALPSLNHGRLYPNIDGLVENGYVSKGELDGRTNWHELTDDGKRVLRSQIAILCELMGGDPEVVLKELGLEHGPGADSDSGSDGQN